LRAAMEKQIEALEVATEKQIEAVQDDIDVMAGRRQRLAKEEKHYKEEAEEQYRLFGPSWSRLRRVYLVPQAIRIPRRISPRR
jgi:hypothetical protein